VSCRLPARRVADQTQRRGFEVEDKSLCCYPWEHHEPYGIVRVYVAKIYCWRPHSWTPKFRMETKPLFLSPRALLIYHNRRRRARGLVSRVGSSPPREWKRLPLRGGGTDDGGEWEAPGQQAAAASMPDVRLLNRLVHYLKPPQARHGFTRPSYRVSSVSCVPCFVHKPTTPFPSNVCAALSQGGGGGSSKDGTGPATPRRRSSAAAARRLKSMNAVCVCVLCRCFLPRILFGFWGYPSTFPSPALPRLHQT